MNTDIKIAETGWDDCGNRMANPTLAPVLVIEYADGSLLATLYAPRKLYHDNNPTPGSVLAVGAAMGCAMPAVEMLAQWLIEREEGR